MYSPPLFSGSSTNPSYEAVSANVGQFASLIKYLVFKPFTHGWNGKCEFYATYSQNYHYVVWTHVGVVLSLV